jgi:tRNA nucleotidyltransferase (CCA-adding enzyme)
MRALADITTPQHRTLELVREVAREKGCHPYLVGGPVRDLLLGRQAIDVDLTLEDGSSTLARALARRLEGRVRSFPQFLTYKVIADGWPEIDIATARTERYRQAGALPTVSPGKLRDDLLRRDFSINAIGMDLTDGSIHDPSGGEADLRSRIVRVLHDQSFVDDPTRIFRAVRLARRLGFGFDETTAALMRSAVEANVLSTITKERIWRELFLAMDEEEAPRGLAALSELGALAALFGSRVADPAQLEAAGAQISRNPALDRYVLYTAALLHGDASPVDLEGSGFSQKRARNVVQVANEVGRFTDALVEATSDRQRFRLLKHVSPEMMSAIASIRPGENQYIERYQQFERFKLPLRGNDLEMPGGPHVARALERTREAVFTGEIPPEEARTFARAMAMKYLQSGARAQEAGVRIEGKS